jgi:hypothetical protein
MADSKDNAKTKTPAKKRRRKRKAAAKPAPKPLAPLDPASIFTLPVEPKPAGKLDAITFAQWKAMGITPARPSSDGVFVRRVYLDVTGTVPTAAEARTFLHDKTPTKRAKLIQALMKRDEFADYWAMRWCDLLRVKAEFPINLWPNAAQAYHRWIRDSIKTNKPYDQFARELLTASGSNFRVAPVNFYRAVQSREPKALAQAAALTFMGSRSDKWDPKRLEAVALFFSAVGYKKTQEWKEEVIYFDSVKAQKDIAAGLLQKAEFPDGTKARLTGKKDPRVVLANWLIRKENPWFARTLVNRVWYWLLGRGIVHEPDDLRPDNPPSNPKLLAYLEREFVRSGYDIQNLFTLILNSATYQLSSVPRSKDPKAIGQFASYPIRRLDAEVLIDALCQITGTKERYTSMIPEPFTFIPQGQRSIALPDGSITSSFLEMFGKPPRDTGLLGERSNQPTAAQRLHLLNSSHVRKKLDQGKLRRLYLAQRKKPANMVKQFYLTILSRYPTPQETRRVFQYGKNNKYISQATMADTAWALINSSEFQYRH